MKETDYYYYDVDVRQSTLCKDTIMHLGDECFSSGFEQDVTGNLIRIYFANKTHAQAFQRFYKLHHRADKPDQERG